MSRASNFLPNPPGGGWAPLTLFLAYRLLISLLLTAPIFFGVGGNFLGQRHPGLYAVTAIGYLGFVLAAGVLRYSRSPSVRVQTLLMVFVDIAAITLILHASGGLQTGLGMLLAISIASGSLLMPGSAGLLFASLATLSILAQQVVTLINHGLPVTAFPQAGLLGAAFFAIATLSHVLSKRLSRSEQLVSQRELDLADMAQLNEYVIQHMQTGIMVVDGDSEIRLLNGTFP